MTKKDTVTAIHKKNLLSSAMSFIFFLITIPIFVDNKMLLHVFVSILGHCDYFWKISQDFIALQRPVAHSTVCKKREKERQKYTLIPRISFCRIRRQVCRSQPFGTLAENSCFNHNISIKKAFDEWLWFGVGIGIS